MLCSPALPYRESELPCHTARSNSAAHWQQELFELISSYSVVREPAEHPDVVARSPAAIAACFGEPAPQSTQLEPQRIQLSRRADARALSASEAADACIARPVSFGQARVICRRHGPSWSPWPASTGDPETAGTARVQLTAPSSGDRILCCRGIRVASEQLLVHHPEPSECWPPRTRRPLGGPWHMVFRADVTCLGQDSVHERSFA